jgi:4-hydroxybenzoyl-CoA reductase subunit alpha
MIKEQVLEMAGTRMEIAPTELDCKDATIFVKSKPEINMPFSKAARKLFVDKGPLVGRGAYTPPKLGGSFKGAAVGTSPAYSFAAQISEVEIDKETGEIKVKEVWDVHDCGQVINPALLHAQVHVALFMGMGEAIWEEVRFDKNGKVVNPNLSDYRLPTAPDMPKVTSELVESYDPAGPWGVKEVGEGATIPTMGCFANAILDAAGVRVNSLPLSYEKVWRALREKEAEEKKARKPIEHGEEGYSSELAAYEM